MSRGKRGREEKKRERGNYSSCLDDCLAAAGVGRETPVESEMGEAGEVVGEDGAISAEESSSSPV